MKKMFLFYAFALFQLFTYAQTVSTFIETNSNGCYGLTIDENFLYVVSSFNGKVFRKDFTGNNEYETFDIGGSGYQGICKVGNFIYVSKPYNGSYGIYRINTSEQNPILQSYISLNRCLGLANRGNELYISSEDKIYMVDLNSLNPSLIQIASGIQGTSGLNGSTIGLKVYDNFLYVSEATGISKIDLNSVSYEKQIITTHVGNSFAKGNNNKFYLTNNNAVYELDSQTQVYSLLTEIEGFIGTYDIVFSHNSLFVTTLEGDYNKVARIDLAPLHTDTENKQQSVLYPSPAKDFLYLSEYNTFDSISILNSSGQLIKTLKLENNKIDVSDLEAGVYFIKSKDVYRRFIKH